MNRVCSDLYSLTNKYTDGWLSSGILVLGNFFYQRENIDIETRDTFDILFVTSNSPKKRVCRYLGELDNGSQLNVFTSYNQGDASHDENTSLVKC